MILPLILIGLAIASAAVVAYGMEPGWAQYHHGLELIVWSRRLEWPLVALSLILCIALIAMIVGGKRRAWFLIGLGPVLALFAHRFSGAAPKLEVDDNPLFMPAADARFVADDEYVVGVSLKDSDFAYPYSLLFFRPVIVQSDREHRVLVLWSAYANRAMAFSVAREMKGRDLEVVSTPANALLVYDSRVGQFINGVTGRTISGAKPAAVAGQIETWKMPWREWRAEHPATQVLMPRGGAKTGGPTGPILPMFPLGPMELDRPANTLVDVVTGSGAVAIDAAAVGTEALNLRVGDEPVLIFRPGAQEPLRAFSRVLPHDLRPRFELSHKKKQPAGAVLVDSDTGSFWNAKGEWLDGDKELKGTRLKHAVLDEDLYWGVMKFWYPDLNLANGND